MTEMTKISIEISKIITGKMTEIITGIDWIDWHNDWK